MKLFILAVLCLVCLFVVSCDKTPNKAAASEAPKVVSIDPDEKIHTTERCITMVVNGAASYVRCSQGNNLATARKQLKGQKKRCRRLNIVMTPKMERYWDLCQMRHANMVCGRDHWFPKECRLIFGKRFEW